jgi:hypothetical protein
MKEFPQLGALDARTLVLDLSFNQIETIPVNIMKCKNLASLSCRITVKKNTT